MVAIGVLGSLGHELDPVFDLSHPGIHAVAGALHSIAHHTNLGESKCIKSINCDIILLLLFTSRSQQPLAGPQSLPDMSPWHCCCHQHKCGNCISIMSVGEHLTILLLTRDSSSICYRKRSSLCTAPYNFLV